MCTQGNYSVADGGTRPPSRMHDALVSVAESGVLNRLPMRGGRHLPLESAPPAPVLVKRLWFPLETTSSAGVRPVSVARPVAGSATSCERSGRGAAALSPAAAALGTASAAPSGRLLWCAHLPHCAGSRAPRGSPAPNRAAYDRRITSRGIGDGGIQPMRQQWEKTMSKMQEEASQVKQQAQQNRPSMGEIRGRLSRERPVRPDRGQ
jgi:hypothetical protein